MHRTRPYLAQLPPTYLFFFLHAAVVVDFLFFFSHVRVLRLFDFLVAVAVFVFPRCCCCCCWPASAAMTYKERATCWSTKRCKFPLTLPPPSLLETQLQWAHRLALAKMCLWPTMYGLWLVVAAGLLKANVVA